jgi:hypothetical protein
MKKVDSLPGILLEITIKALWAPPLVFFLHSLAARRFGHEPYVDPVMHLAGGAAMAWLFWKSLCSGRRYLGNPSVMTIVMLAFGLTTLTAIAWECMEYMLSLSKGYEENWGLANTLRDLVLGMSGAALVLGIATKGKLHAGSTAGV